MKRPLLARGTFAAALLCGLFLVPMTARASDHNDAPGVLTDPSTDITDLYTWMSSDGSQVNLVLNVFPSATTTAHFSTTARYVFHVESRASFGVASSRATDIICTFDASQHLSCWVGASDYVTGDASATAGITSASGKVRVFAGLRSDPAFFNRDGFVRAVSIFDAAAGSLGASDAAGCPPLSSGQVSILVSALQQNSSGTGQGVDAFHATNVLSIVMTVDKSLLLFGSDTILSVWASTRSAS